MSLRCNVGGVDRALRVVAGSMLFAAGVWLLAAHHGYGLIALVLGLIGLVTGITRFCVLYVPFGISTARPASPSGTDSKGAKVNSTAAYDKQ